MPIENIKSWTVVDGHHIHKVFRFPDFLKALEFVNRIAVVAEAQNHHPDLLLTWGKVEVTSYTHTADGLTEKDYTLAAAIDGLIA
ncbi:MAG: phhB [Bryobacterales bacterium]|jgi:4a-hydroxytetrahydrobiopterin dehydratase|nr:phhB [Bryobacterales bacterium]